MNTELRRRSFALGLLLSGPLAACDQLGIGGDSKKSKSKDDDDDVDDDDKKKKKKAKKDDDDDKKKSKKDEASDKPEEKRSLATNHKIIAWALGTELVKLGLGRSNKVAADREKKAADNCETYAKGLGATLPPGPLPSADAEDYGAKTLAWAIKDANEAVSAKLQAEPVALALFKLSLLLSMGRISYKPDESATYIKTLDTFMPKAELPAALAQPLRDKLSGGVDYKGYLAALTELDQAVTKHLLALKG